MFDNLNSTTIKEMIDQRRWNELRTLLMECPAPEVADLLMELDKRERAFLFRLLPRQLSAEIFTFMEPTQQNALLKDLTDEETRQLLAGMEPDDRIHLLEALPDQVTQRLLNLLGPEDLREARWLLGYPEESVGRLMTPDYVAVRPEWTIERALSHIRNVGKDIETINVIYVVDRSWRLIDALELRRFVLADPHDTVEQVMDYTFVSITAFEDREKAVETILRYDLNALPVVGSEGVLLGVVTVDDVLDVAQQEATEDFQKVGAVAPLRTSYHETGVRSLYRKRIGWLVALVLVNLVSSGVIAAYEETIAAAIALAFFIPLLIDSGGNTGSQAATLMIRALATGDVGLDEWVRVISKELAIGFALGISMGAAGWMLGVVRGGLPIAMVVAFSMVSIVLVANLIGVALPFILIRLRLDPAVASSPLITSIMDATGLIIYFSIASWLLATQAG